MLQFIIAFIVSTFIISNAWSKCLEPQVMNSKINPFTINLGSSETINIPMMVEGQQACYHQRSVLNIKSESSLDTATIDYEISPLHVDFENVPNSQIVQYIDIDYKDDKPSKVRIMSFLCSGEIPVGADALNGVLNQETDNDLSITISTGQMADSLQVAQQRKAKAKVYFQFLKTFEEKTESVENLTGSNVYIPTIIAENTINPIDYKIYTTFFNRTNSTLNGCSEVFKSKMQDYLFENVIKNQPFRNIEIKKKLFSNRYKMKWTL